MESYIFFVKSDGFNVIILFDLSVTKNPSALINIGVAGFTSTEDFTVHSRFELNFPT